MSYKRILKQKRGNKNKRDLIQKSDPELKSQLITLDRGSWYEQDKL